MTEQNGVERSGKSEVLRRMLDKRGVDWTANDGEHVKETCWPYMGELTAAFAEYDNGTTRFACDTWCFTPEQAVAATVGTQEVYLLMGTDTYDGREYVLGVFSTEEQAEAAISDNRYGYGLHNVQRWEVDA